MNATVVRWLRDPGFQALPVAAQRAAMERFFDERLINDEFRRMPSAQQAGVRAAFVQEHMPSAPMVQAAPQRGVLDETVSSLASGLGAVLEGVSGTAEMILPEGMGKESAGDFRRAVGRARQSDYLRRPEHLTEGTVLEHPERLADWRWWVRSLGENIPNMAAMFLPGLGAVKAGKVLGMGAQAIRWLGRLGAWSGAATIEAGYAYGQAKDEMAAEGRLSDDQIESVATMEGAAVGVVNGILEILPFDNLVLRSAGADRVLKRIARQAIVEGATETAQEAVSFYAEKLGHKPDQELKDNIGRLLESGLIGAVLGGGAGMVMGGGAGMVMGPEAAAAAPGEAEREPETAVSSEASIEAAADAAGRAAAGGQAPPVPMDDTGAAPEAMTTRPGVQNENQREAHKAKARADAENMLNFGLPPTGNRTVRSVLSEIYQETDDVTANAAPWPGGRRVAPVRTGPASSLPQAGAAAQGAPPRPQQEISPAVRSLIGGRRVAPVRTTPPRSVDPTVQALADADAQGVPAIPVQPVGTGERAGEISEAVTPSEQVQEPGKAGKEAAEKEQWQMTRDEFEAAADIKKYGRYGEKGISIVYPDGTREWIKKDMDRPLDILKNKIDQRYKRVLSKAYFEEKHPVPLELRKPEGLAEQWEKSVDQVIDETAERYKGNIREDVIRDNHRKFVEQAVAEGKDVPAEVLADYPDLAPRRLNEELSLRSAAKTITGRKLPKKKPSELGEKKDLSAFISTITGKKPTKRGKSLTEYRSYVDQLSETDRERVADMIEEAPKSPALLLTRIKKAVAEPAAPEALTAAEEEPTIGVTEEEVSHGEIRRPVETVSGGIPPGGAPEVGERGPIEPVLRVPGRGGAETERGPGELGDGGLYGRGDREERSAGPVGDYTITPADRLGQGGPKQKFRDNVAAIKLLAELETRPVTPEDQSILVKYVGWGGLSQAFPRPDGSIARGWESEVEELRALLPEAEYAAARRAVEPQYSIEPGAGELSLEDVRAVFAGQDVGMSATDPGVFWVRLKNGRGLEIRRVDRIDPDQAAIDVAYGQMDDEGVLVAGKYQAGVIEISRDIGDRWTLAHESVHFLEDAGLLTAGDVNALRRHIRRLTDTGQWETRNRDDIGGSEDRAAFVSDRLARRTRLSGPVGRILQKVKDIIDALVNLVRRTAAGVVRDIERGAVYERAVTGLGGAMLNPARYEQTAGRWYSAMESYLSEKLPGSGSVKQIKQTIASWAKKGIIKSEELEWSGLEGWLDEQSGKVSRQDVLDYLAENHVRVEQVIKGGPEASDDPKYFDDLKKAYQEVRDSDYLNDWLFAAEEIAEKYNLDNDAVYNDLHELDSTNEGNTKFSQWQMPGGENYRELLLTLPRLKGATPAQRSRFMDLEDRYDKLNVEEKAEYDRLSKLIDYDFGAYDYQSSHWDESNVLAHVRFNERIDADGNRVLFIEEIQSDWHQEGRRKGYTKDFEKVLSDLKAKYPSLPEDTGEWSLNILTEVGASQVEKDRWYDARMRGRVPDAPFKKTWPMLAFKRMVRYAAENGFGKIAWTPGEVQANRYDLSKQVDSIDVLHNGYPGAEGTFDINAEKDGHVVFTQQGLKKNHIADYIGKELAEKAIADTTMPGSSKTYSGIDLKVGGEGMKGFYDKILPAAVNKFFNKSTWGKAKVGTIEIVKPPSTDEGYFARPSEDQNYRWDIVERETGQIIDQLKDNELPEDYANIASPEKRTPVWSLSITDKMRSKALREGMPLFSLVRRQAPGPAVTQELENDRTFANKLHEMADVARENVSAASAKLQVRVQELAGKASRKRFTVGLGYHKKVRESMASRRLDQAMFFYRDLGGDLSRIAEFRQRAQQGIDDGTIKGPRKVYIGQVIKALEVAEKLSADQVEFIDEMADRFEAAFEIARGSKVIQSHVDNYVRRIYKRKKADGDTAVYSGWSTGGHGFRVYHGAAQKRSYDTALDAILDGHELAVTGLTSAYDNYMRELVTVLANKAFIQRGSNSTDASGRRLFTTNTNRVKGYEDYRELKASGFSVWQLTGTISAVDERGMGGVLETNSWGRKVFITKPERVPRSWAVYKPGGLRPSKVFYDNPLYDAKAAARDWADGKGYDDVRERPPKEVADQFQKLKLYAPANIADMINKMTATDPLFSQTPGLKAVARLNAGVKSWVLMTSFFHHLAGARSWVFGVHHGWGRGKHIVVSADGERVLAEFKDLDKARQFVRDNADAVIIERSKAAPWRSYKAGLDKVYDLHPLVSMGVKNGLTLGELQDWSESALREDGGLTERLVKHFGWERAAGMVERFRFTRERWTNSLFKKYFAGLKAEAFVVEYVHELSRAQEKHAAGKGPAVNADKVAEKVARLINSDFGGLHLRRMGRNPTLQLFGRLILLAPDWTESNFRTVSGMIPGLNEKINELVGDVPPPPGMDDIYRRFWGRVMVRIAVSTIIAQLLLNGQDETEEFLQEQMFSNRFNRFRWTEIDISRLYEMMGIDLEGQRKTFSLGGHFFDPLKLIDPWRLIKGKASPAMRALGAGLSGSDWAERPFTGVRELVTTGRTVKTSAFERKEAGLNRLPSTVINQVINMQPIQMGQLMRYIQGEEDGLTALMHSAGAHVHTAWTPRAEDPVEDVPGYGDVFSEVRRLKTAGVLRMGPPDRRMTVGGVPAKMTAAQYDAYLRGSSGAAMRRLKSLIYSAGYKSWGDARRAAKVQSVIKNARARERKKVKRQLRKAA